MVVKMDTACSKESILAVCWPMTGFDTAINPSIVCSVGTAHTALIRDESA